MEPTPMLPLRPDRPSVQVVQVLFAPVLLIGFGGLIVAIAASSISHVWIVAVVVAAIGFSTWAERIAPYEPSWNADHDDRTRDRIHALVNETSSALGVVVLPVLTGAFTISEVWPAASPFVFQVLVAVVVLDAGITVTHWGSHRIGSLWRFHAVHHSVTRTYGLNGLMKHPIHQLIETAVGVTPLVLVGVPQAVAAAAAGLVAIQLLAQHSNVDYRVGKVGSVLALNAGHRLHHVEAAGEGDVNFGLFTLVWDRLLGTHRDPGTDRVGDGDLGITDRPDYPSTYRAQLVEPFRRPRR